MKAEKFTNHFHVEIWFPSRLMENLAQPDQWKLDWNFNINDRLINSKPFQIFYVGNKYLANIICFVSGHDIGMPVRDDVPDWCNTKTRNFIQDSDR